MPVPAFRHARRIALPALLCIAALFGRPSTAAAAEPLRVRVLSYNIHHGEGVDRRLDLERIANVVKSVRPDLVSLQEVDRNTKRTNNVDQPAELARLTGMQAVFERNIDFEGGQYGNVILSKWKIDRHKNHHLPSLDDGEQRGVLVADVRPPETEETILFLATHLDHRSNHRERLESAQAINQLVGRRGQTPAILAGDLNDLPDSAVLEEFGKQWSRANEKPLPTVPVDEPKRQIDYILLRPAARWKVIECRVLDEAVASDHRPVFAVLELAETSP